MNEYVFSVVFEIRKPASKQLRSNFDRQIRPSEIVHRLLGRTLTQGGAVKGVWLSLDLPTSNSRLQAVRIIELHGPISLVGLTFDLTGAEGSARRLSYINSGETVAILKALELEPCKHATIHGVVASLASPNLGFETRVSDSWLNVACEKTAMNYWIPVATEIALRVGIERVLLQNALNSRLRSPLSAILSHLRVRRWAVELMPDKSLVRDLYKNLRASLNQPAVRAEVLDRSRTWWVVAAVLVSIVGVFLGGIALWVR
jgi:hypothetical protein